MAAKNEKVQAIWDKRPERVVTVSTGIVHVAVKGTPICGAVQASRVASNGITPTCKNCGAK